MRNEEGVITNQNVKPTIAATPKVYVQPAISYGKSVQSMGTYVQSMLTNIELCGESGSYVAYIKLYTSKICAIIDLC